MKKKSSVSFRIRDFSCITYVSPPDFSHILPLCNHYAYIKHDDEGVEPHYHVLLRFTNAHTESAVLSLFRLHSDQNTLIDDSRHIYKCFQYLTHQDSPDKKQYPISDIVCDSLFYWQSLIDEDDVPVSNSRVLTLLQDLGNHVPLPLMVQRYGRDFVLNYDKYKSFLSLMQLDEKKK